MRNEAINIIKLVLLIFLFLFSSHCFSRPLLDITTNEPSFPSKGSFTVTIHSIPSGARVYAVTGNNNLGKYLGTTPLTLKYSIERGTVYGSNTEALHFYTKVRRQILKCKVILVKPGYYTKQLEEYIIYTNVSIVLAIDFIKDKYLLRSNTEINGILARIENEVTEKENKPQQQQQQQQQQQVVVIPENNNPQSTNSKGTIHITSNVEFADVNIDGMFVGNTPCTLSLKEGIHIIKISAEGYNNYKKEIRILSDSEIPLFARLKEME